MVSEHALLRAVSFLFFFGIVVNASVVNASVVNASLIPDPRSAVDGNDPGVGVSSSSVVCIEEALDCQESYGCISCVNGLADDDGTDDGDSSTYIPCGDVFNDAICDFFGTSFTCLADDAYVAYVECVLEASFGCPVELCGDGTDDNGCSDFFSNGCPDGFRYTDGYCVGGVCDISDCCTYDGDFDGTVGSFVGAYKFAVFGGVASTFAAAFAGLPLF